MRSGATENVTIYDSALTGEYLGWHSPPPASCEMQEYPVLSRYVIAATSF